MVSAERVLLVVGADRREFSGFWPLQLLPPAQTHVRWSALVEPNSQPLLLAAHGPGRDNASEAVQRLCGQQEVGAIVSTGYAGGLAPELSVGDIFVATSVRRLKGPLEYAVELPVGTEDYKQGSLVTVDEVVQDVAAKALLRQSGADAVDMEAAAVAEQAKFLGLPFYCVRAMSDDASTGFEVDFNKARRRDGTFSGWRVAAQAGLSPSKWSHLMQLRQNGERASAALGTFFQSATFPPQSL